MPDRENVIRLVEEEIRVCESVNQCYRTIDLPALRDILALLKEQPEIVRCKDCRVLSSPPGSVMFCEHIHEFVDAEWFCADGERKG